MVEVSLADQTFAPETPQICCHCQDKLKLQDRLMYGYINGIKESPQFGDSNHQA